MRSTFKTVFYVNGSKERNGIVPIMGRVTINGTIAQFSCKQSVTKAIWDAKGNRAIGKSKEAKEVNFALDNIKAQIAKHYQRLSDREAFVTAEMVRNAYQGIGTEYETLLRAFDKENAAFALIGVSHHFSGNERLTVGKSLVMLGDLSLDVVERKIHLLGFFTLAYGSVALGIPDSLGNALLATELCDSSVDCHTSHDRDNSVSLLASIYIEDCLESASHNSYFFVRCKIKL